VAADATGVVLALAVLGGYLLGSIPFGLLLTRAAGLGDLRSIGSGNIGATNVLRTGRRALAAATLMLDVAKGAAAVLVVDWVLGDAPADAELAAGLAVVLGHMFPPWLKFRGGKGVATALGVILVLSWPAGLLTAATWLLVVLALRISSLAALVAALAAPIYVWLFAEPAAAWAVVAITTLVWIRHHQNIARLLAGR